MIRDAHIVKYWSRSLWDIRLIISVLTGLFLFGCGGGFQQVDLGTKTFNYKIPPVVKLESGKTIAVLASRTDASQTLQARLMEGLQKINMNIADSQQLANIVQERSLKLTAGDLREFGEKTNVHLFLVAEEIAPGKVAMKVLESDGRVGFARFLEAKSEEEIVDGILKLFSGYDKSFTSNPGFIFPKEDNNRVEIVSLYNDGKYQKVEEIFKLVLAANPSDVYKMTYNVNLFNLYGIQERFQEASAHLEEAEKANQRLGIGTGFIQPSWFPKAKSELMEMANAAIDAKAASGTLSSRKNAAPTIAVLPFDAKAIQNPSLELSLEWIPAVYVSTKLAQSNGYNIYDRDYFRALMETESKLSDKERGELLGVDYLVYGKFMGKPVVSRRPILKKEVTSYQDPTTGKLVCCVEKLVLDRTQVGFKLSLQGRIVDIKTAFGKFQTFDHSVDKSFDAKQPIPTDQELINSGIEQISEDFVSWIDKTRP